MLALSLWRPWPWSIFHAKPAHLRKRIENRIWTPPAKLIGQRFAIHASKTYDNSAIDFIRAGLGLDDENNPTGLLSVESYDEGIIGTAVLKDVAASEAEVERFAGGDQLRWWIGPYAWVLADVRPLTTRLPCKGRQKLWALPADVERGVLEQLAA